MTVDIPPAMIENRISQLINELSLQLQARGMNFEKYMQMTGNDMDRMRESYREGAAIDIRDELMLEAVAKAENIEVDPKELEYEIALMAATYRATPKQVIKILKENHQFSAINGSIRRRKAMQIIFDSMKVSRADLNDAKLLLDWKPETHGVMKSADGSRMNEVKCHLNWARRIKILSEIYGVENENLHG